MHSLINEYYQIISSINDNQELKKLGKEGGFKGVVECTDLPWMGNRMHFSGGLQEMWTRVEEGLCSGQMYLKEQVWGETGRIEGFWGDLEN